MNGKEISMSKVTFVRAQLNNSKNKAKSCRVLEQAADSMF